MVLANILDITFDGEKLVARGKASYSAKDILKDFGFKWDKDNKQWYFVTTDESVAEQIKEKVNLSYNIVVELHNMA